MSYFPDLKDESVVGEPAAANPTVNLLDDANYVRSPWKNGLGETHQIAISPPTADFEADDFLWRLQLSEVRDSCSLSVYPGYDIALLLLPTDKPAPSARRNSVTSPVALHHNDQATAVPLRPLQPYTYSGEWPTTCRLRTSPVRHLTFIANRDRTRVSATLENICLHGLHSDGECGAEHEINGSGAPRSASPEPIDDDTSAVGRQPSKPNGSSGPQSSSKMLLGNTSILYVVTGTVKVNVEGSDKPYVVKTGQTLICHREDDASPTDLTMKPVQLDGTDFPKETDHQDASVLIIQINHIQRQRRESSLADLGPVRPRGRTGSIIVYDDQPIPVYSDPSATPQLPTNPTSPSEMPIRNWDSARHYKPPVFSSRFQNESEVPPAVGLSEWLRIPVIVARGKEEGPVVGITAVVHGNELNGVPCIHRVISDIDVSFLRGTVVAVPCVNVPGYLRYTREFSDGKDLNRLFPGSPTGTSSQIYAYNLMQKVVRKFDYLIDLHTASFGRVNSYYVRCDMNDARSASMAKLQQPQIILHNSGQDGECWVSVRGETVSVPSVPHWTQSTKPNPHLPLDHTGALRSAAMSLSIASITVEIGNPQLFQNQFVQWSYQGVMRILSWLSMFTPTVPITHIPDALPPSSTILCSKGYWIYTRTGGVLEVYPGVNSVVKKGDLVARIKNIFGNIVDEVFAPGTGVTIGRSSNPVAMAGDRVLHMGVIKREGEVLAKEAKENY
ncbi:uncharacterized protein EV422DRAFT_249081 [Fimicolochytrium jonesii]|uniref:uncharacterized protein n=1 Tax=Fimicolochytrium jonesii TaxID=1396493 RepID=UPI0022FDEF08|nr:uncharacterized protein EV422DRAFT_249081 [Fimicolochytrium jonesii]KAI8825179.1 hypothetical protein EV422DRAFT_249081 [Fimicolochytrium jonesii]